MRADGITVSAIGLGDDVQRGLLRELAQLGGGRAHFTRDPAQIPRLFSAEAALVARELRVERPVGVQQVAPAAFLRDVPIADAPPLRGYVATRRRPSPAEVILETDRGAPLLARMRVGLGWSLALTTDLKGRWAADWLRWPALGRLLAQLVREHMRRDPASRLAFEARLEADTLVATVEVRDARERFVNALTGELTARPFRSEKAARVPLVQVAPGRYQARLALPMPGTYAVAASLRGPEGTRRAEAAVTRGYPLEYRPHFGEDRLPLGEAERLGMVQPLPPPTELGRPDGRLGARWVERWPCCVGLALLLFVLDVTVRRLRPAARTGA